MLNHKPKLGQVPYLFLIAASLFLVGFGKLITGGFTWREFATPSFWLTTFYTLTANLCIVMGALKRRLYLLKGNVKEVNDNEEIINTFSMRGEDASFVVYCDEYNLGNKITAYKTKIKAKLKKAIDHNRKKKIQKFTTMLTDDYINDNINYIKIKYFFISPSTITSGYTPKKLDKPIESSASYLVRNLSPKFLISIGITLAVTAFALQPNPADSTLMFKLLSNLIILIMNFIWGDDFAHQYIKEYVLTNLHFRVNFIKGYLAWKAKRGA